MTTWMDIAFSPAVKAVQERRGSRQAYARMEAKGTSRTEIDTELAHFISEARSFYLATASRDGQPYVQHRGGPPGFLRALDPRTLAFADFTGNRQYISTGNLADNPRAMIFIMNYETQQRVKIWGTAEVVEKDTDLIETIIPKDYPARTEAAMVFHVASLDANCHQHIPRMVLAEEASALSTRITALEAENAQLRKALALDHTISGDAS